MLKWLVDRARSSSAVFRARAAIAVLPADDAVAATQAITRSLATINGANGLTLQERYDEIQGYDAAVVENTMVLLREYLHTSRQKKQRETELWSSAYGCWNELAAAYAACVQRYSTETREVAAFYAMAPVASARALRALRRQLQWIRLRYAVPADDLWRNLANLYAFVEQGGVDKALEIYPGETTTIKEEFLRVLMQSALSTDRLRPREQTLAASLVSRSASMFVLSRTLDPGCTHWFDLAQPHVPKRVTRLPRSDGDPRYFGAGSAVGVLEQILLQIEPGKELPNGLSTIGQIDFTKTKEVFAHIYQEWTGKKRSRFHERRKMNSRITVVPGFDDMLRIVEFANSDSLDFTDLPAAESWVIDDISEGGYGTMIPSVVEDWVDVGCFVAIEHDVPCHWQVGIVRRVQRDADNQQHVGIEVLSQTAIIANVGPDAIPSEGYEQPGNSHRVLLLSTGREPGDSVELLVRAQTVIGTENIFVWSDNGGMMLRPDKIVERNATCERVVCMLVN